MRNLLVLVIAASLAVQAAACSCFTPEMRDKAGRETLERAQVAVFGQIVEVKADGTADLLVLESFKGPAKGAIIQIAPSAGKCSAHAGIHDQNVLVVAFQAPITSCETYDQEHFLLEVFRSNSPK